jgi:hypothetical protein
MLGVQAFLEQSVEILQHVLWRETDPDARRVIRRLLRQQERHLAELEHRVSTVRVPARPEAAGGCLKDPR